MYTPLGLKIKPAELYDEIKNVAKARFGHDLPEDPKKLNCLSTPVNKLALLKEICQKIGIQLELDSKRTLQLSNNLSEVLANLNAELTEDVKDQSKKKKKETTPLLTEADLLNSYKHLPFNVRMVSKMYATFKHMRDTSIDARQFLFNGSQA